MNYNSQLSDMYKSNKNKIKRFLSLNLFMGSLIMGAGNHGEPLTINKRPASENMSEDKYHEKLERERTDSSVETIAPKENNRIIKMTEPIDSSVKTIAPNGNERQPTPVTILTRPEDNRLEKSRPPQMQVRQQTGMMPQPLFMGSSSIMAAGNHGEPLIYLPTKTSQQPAGRQPMQAGWQAAPIQAGWQAAPMQAGWQAAPMQAGWQQPAGMQQAVAFIPSRGQQMQPQQPIAVGPIIRKIVISPIQKRPPQMQVPVIVRPQMQAQKQIQQLAVGQTIRQSAPEGQTRIRVAAAIKQPIIYTTAPTRHLYVTTGQQ